MLTSILFALIAAFVAYEAVAHWVKHNVGMVTLSHLILTAEKRWGWPIRALVACVVVALGVHLEGGF